jgi:hypothetical protein
MNADFSAADDVGPSPPSDHDLLFDTDAAGDDQDNNDDEQSSTTNSKSNHQAALAAVVSCSVCHQPLDPPSDPRQTLQFFALSAPDPATTLAAPSVTTFLQDIPMHVFCGKTAAIVARGVLRPDLEILTRAGIKNKHGTGADINVALARTRGAIAVDEKEYFIVREFEVSVKVKSIVCVGV